MVDRLLKLAKLWNGGASGIGMWLQSRWMLTSDVFGHLDESTQVGNEGYLWNGVGYGIGQTWTSDDDSKTLCS